ncbi:2-C-methyl-D-erythritol 2,4-cyclodiphosphate synthase [Desmospora profundinema]|uniref:2-C-methyl-D-erythritol 2,4-cyclodiphosphate synthase n=1 Tax=Desmospora profundinema TaxID=1571184 RepID=A0ABU1IQK3_9BACL|nr:2-C-methyl-D-erythritol 2,4-cyclodiphosphate synthase [Desmospora profundinema]MDR6226986.1 2-C-methyl-D-erythritol 2,4-cyclodiphosphate synthase [Desmospora profundinema]
MKIKVGQGFDVHRFSQNRPLILGGVEIPHDRGLAGHSDADVLLHAISDAILGAIGQGDIGRHFPDTDPTYEGADSAELLRTIWGMVEQAGYHMGNLDATVITQTPKMAPHIPMIRERVAQLVKADVTDVNIKATTTERLGFTGREEGIAAMAVVCLVRE